MNGYLGRILHVDLDKLEVWNEKLDEEYARQYVGGSSLAARIIYNLVDANTDPLGPENPLVFMTGPLVGTSLPSAGRCSVCALSPLTGIWGEANTGGFFGPELRFSGYDGILIRGRSNTPVWLSIQDGSPQIHEAGGIWGQDTYVTQSMIREAMGDARARVACIGPAGEKQVKMAGIFNDEGRAAARTGLGAVMGAKNLKAIGVRGSQRIPVHDADGLKATSQAVTARTQQDMPSMALRMAGTAGVIDVAIMYGDFPIGYYQRGEWDEASNLSGVLVTEKFLERNRSCFRCPIACGRVTRAPSYGAEKVDGPEYETLGALGSLAMIGDLEAVIYANHLCNQYGMDTISTGATIALACEMFQRGIITSSDTGGMELRYGDAGMSHKLIGMMAYREGIGGILAEGSAALADRFGCPELAVTVNRLEVPLHDPRAFAGMAVSYALSPRGACHMEGDMYGLDMGQCPVPELGIMPGDRFDSSEGKGRVSARLQAWRNLYNAMILCQFQNPGMEHLLSAMNSITGWGLAKEDLMMQGKRIVTLKRLLNIKRGLKRSDDRLPSLLMKPLEGGGTAGHVPDMNALLAGAYSEFGWDPVSARPTAETLRTLSMDFTLE